jgi:hypothetical protein
LAADDFEMSRPPALELEQCALYRIASPRGNLRILGLKDSSDPSAE